MAVFVDAAYWIAAINPDDQWHEAAVQARERLPRNERLVTTQEVLTEFLANMSGRGAYHRQLAVDRHPRHLRRPVHRSHRPVPPDFL